MGYIGSCRWMIMSPLLPPAPTLLGSLGLLMLLAGGATAASITGVCPDGSIFIVQRAASIPCARAKLVEPHEIPPVRPELLPNPYTWQVYNEGASPNNPYNLIDEARKVRALSRKGAGPAPEQVSPSPSLPSPVAQALEEPSDLGLSEEELRDLFLIVELSQDASPAAFVKETADGREAFALSFAWSPAFAQQLAARHPRGAELEDAQVLLFSAVARRAEEFHPNFTFTQRHLAFSPVSGEASQLGVLLGALGQLEEGEVVLGWIALPGRMSLHEPMGVYWNDRHLETVFNP
jgi:hypothetical protein